VPKAFTSALPAFGNFLARVKRFLVYFSPSRDLYRYVKQNLLPESNQMRKESDRSYTSDWSGQPNPTKKKRRVPLDRTINRSSSDTPVSDLRRQFEREKVSEMNLQKNASK
jgi:hypothetical protein